MDDVKAGPGGDLAAVMGVKGGRQEPDADLHSLERQWLQAEHALYPMIFAQPEVYEASVRLVRAVAERLREVSAARDLAHAWRGWRGLVLSAARRTGISLDDVDAGLVGGAGFCFRLRQLQAESRRMAPRAPFTVPPDCGWSQTANRADEKVRVFSEPEARVEAGRALRQHHDGLAVAIVPDRPSAQLRKG